MGTVRQCTMENCAVVDCGHCEAVYDGALRSSGLWPLWSSEHSIQWGSLECVVKHCTVKQCREGHSGIVERGGALWSSLQLGTVE